MSVAKPVASLLQPPWNGMTLPGLLSGAATLRANAPFLVDAEDVEALAHRPRRSLSCLELKNEVERFALQMRTLGLNPGDVVILHLPNTVEAVIALLGVQAAGGVPAPAAIFETVEALRRFVELTQAAAMISMDSFAGLHPAEQCRTAASFGLSIRFLAAFERNPPGGVISLMDWEDGEIDRDTPLPEPSGGDAALITFDNLNGMHRALVRTHEQIVAESAGAAALSRVGVGDRLLVTISPATIAGVIYGIALPLLSGALVELNALFDSCAFAAQLGDGEQTTVVLPGTSEAAFHAFCETRRVCSESLVFIHRPEFEDVAAPLSAPKADARVVDVTCLGESFIGTSVRGADASLGLLPVRKPHPVPGVMVGDAAHHQFSVDSEGKLFVSGPMTPRRIGENARARIATGFTAEQRKAGVIALNAQSDLAENAA